MENLIKQVQQYTKIRNELLQEVINICNKRKLINPLTGKFEEFSIKIKSDLGLFDNLDYLDKKLSKEHQESLNEFYMLSYYKDINIFIEEDLQIINMYISICGIKHNKVLELYNLIKEKQNV